MQVVSSTVTVIDNLAPVIEGCPSDGSKGLTTDCTYIMEDFTITLSGSDNCTNYEDISIVQTPAPGTVIIGEQELDCIITLTDLFGNEEQCEFSLIIFDQAGPVIDCIDILTVGSNVGCSYEVEALETYIDISDNCNSIASVIQTPAIGEIISETTPAILTVTDSTGNVSTCQFIIEIENTTEPLIECLPDQQLELTSNCAAILPDYSNSLNASGSCGSEIVSIVQEPKAGIEITSLTVITLTAIDSEGNSANCSLTVDVVNNFAPEIECADDQYLELLNTCSAIVPDFSSKIQVSTQCGSELISITQEPAAGEEIDSDQVVLITAVDSEGNSSTCEFELKLIDTIAPVIECPENIVQTDSIVNYDLPEFSDNCDAELSLYAGLASGMAFSHGFTDVTYIAEDLAGNTDTCSFSVLINDSPIAVNDTLKIGMNIELFEGSILVNDFDPDGDEFFLTSIINHNESLNFSFSEEGNLIVDISNGWCGRDSITYMVCDEFGACSEGIVYLEIECSGLFISQGFSPNGDGVNDVFTILGLEEYPNHKIQVINRWGAVVYESESYQNDWEGVANSNGFLGNDRLPVGTYFIIVDLGDGSEPFRSYIQLEY